MQNKKTTVTIILLVLLALVCVIGLGLFTKKKLVSQEIENTSSDKTFIYQEEAHSGTLLCQLMTSQMENTPFQISKDVVVLQSADCLYKNKSGEIDSVVVPLAFFNKTTNQFYLIGTSVDDIGEPSPEYIKSLSAAVIGQQGADPTIRLVTSYEGFKTNPKILKFFDDFSRNTAKKSWDLDFTKTGDKKYLPKYGSNKSFYFAASFNYVVTQK